MSDRSENVAKAALELPEDERVDLIVRLLDSVDEPGEIDEAEIDAAWGREADRRYQAYKRGETKGVPIEDVLKMLRDKEQ